jgi:hypothetical protein
MPPKSEKPTKGLKKIKIKKTLKQRIAIWRKNETRMITDGVDLQRYDNNPRPKKPEIEVLKSLNKEFDSIDELKNEQKKIRQIKNNKLGEQSWVNTNLQPIIDFMGEPSMWEHVVPNIDKSLLEVRRGSRSGIPPSEYNRAFFSGAHWTGIKANDTTVFDPYDTYQIDGTNQFCQVYTMMYLTDRLPPETQNNFKKYYTYTKNAIEFIISVLETYKYGGADDDEKQYNKEYHVNRAKNCLEYYKVCLNSLELP